MTPRERQKLAAHLAQYVFGVLNGPKRIAAKFSARACHGTADSKGEVEGAGLVQAPLADHLEAELSRYVLAQRKARHARREACVTSQKQCAHARQLVVPHIYRRAGIWRVRMGWGLDWQVMMARAHVRTLP
jgi:hypothetical protein